MRAILSIALEALILCGCGSDAQPGPAAPRPTSAPPAPVQAAPLRRTAEDGAYELLRFDLPLAETAVDVVDLGMGRDLAGPLRERGAALAVNAGFFDQEGRAEGLVVARGQLLSPLAASLGGGVLTLRDGLGALEPAELVATPPRRGFAIQGFPRLVQGGEAVPRRSTGRSADRTALCLLRDGRTLVVFIARSGDEQGLGGPTIFELAGRLVDEGCQAALNLDGGPSTGVAWRNDDGGISELPPRGPLRQGLLFSRAAAQ